MDLKKIDLNKLQDYAFTPNEIAMSPMTSWNSKFINIKCLDNEDLVPTAKAISLDKFKQAREEIEQAYGDFDGYDPCALCWYSSRVDEILDRLISEVEDV